MIDSHIHGQLITGPLPRLNAEQSHLGVSIGSEQVIQVAGFRVNVTVVGIRRTHTVTAKSTSEDVTFDVALPAACSAGLFTVVNVGIHNFSPKGK